MRPECGGQCLTMRRGGCSGAMKKATRVQGCIHRRDVTVDSAANVDQGNKPDSTASTCRNPSAYAQLENNSFCVAQSTVQATPKH